MRSARWISRDWREERVAERPWLEAPAPWAYDELPRERPSAEAQDEEEEARVVIIEM